MNKILITALAASIIMQSAVYAQNDIILPDAKNDLVYTVLTDDLPQIQPVPAETPTTDESVIAIPVPDLIIESVPGQMAEPTPQPTIIPSHTSKPVLSNAITADTFTANFTVEGQGFNKQQDIIFALYDGDTLLDECTYYIMADERTFSVKFDVPEYTVGKKFEIVCTEGAKAMRYYEDLYETGERVCAPTYHYIENGERVVVTETAMNIITEKDKAVNIYVENHPIELKTSPRIVNGTIMIPVRETSEALGVFDVTYNAEYNSVRVAVAEQEILFNIDYPWTTVNGKTQVDNVSTRYYDGSVYVPLDTLVKGLGSEKEEWDHDTYTDILLTRSKYIVNSVEKVRYVTEQKLTSQTEYLIWVSKKNYEVNVFKNSGGIWNFVDVFPCSIGTDQTPTCVGTYRYYEKIDRWNYPDFYVAPVMRFNGGYAIHSTLLKYDGTDYNRSVRKKSSHGCVRVQPPEMQWLVDNIPMYTTIHVTNI